MPRKKKTNLPKMHERLAAACDALLDGVVKLDNEGNKVVCTPSAAHLNIVRQFLNDNGVSALPNQNESMKKLVAKAAERNLKLVGGGQLPPDEDDEAFGRKRAAG